MDEMTVVLLGAAGAGKSGLAAILGAMPNARAETNDGVVRVSTATARRRYTFLDAPAAQVQHLLGSHVHGALLVVGGADGVMPATRAHIEAAKQAGVPIVAAYLSAPEGGLDTELLELVALEVRDLLAKFEAGGDATVVAWGPQGLSAVAGALDAWR